MIWINGAQKRLDASHYKRGCPLATIALETTADDVALRAALAKGFAALRDRIANSLTLAGYDAAGAHATAALLTYLKLQRPKEPDHE